MLSINYSRLRPRAILCCAVIFAASGHRAAFGQDTMAGMRMTRPLTPNPLGVSMERGGSGTTWIPDAVRLPSLHFSKGSWDLMVHGFVFGEYVVQDGPRGDSQLGSLNWGMFMATRELGGGRFQARTMVSLDPGTVTARGYPLLLQTGETYRGKALHDRQHPHDFWMELGLMYERAVTSGLGVSLYAAPSGEPALGPVAFMHRPSAMDVPFAPLSHHWQDATHVSFGVLTGGLFTNQWKIEGSVFNGREPDEDRWDFDPLALDSYSGRLTYNPTKSWSAAAGYGYLKSPEPLMPSESMHRVTASLMHGAPIGAEGQIATTVVYGGNKHAGHHISNSFLLESEAVVDRTSTFFARVEAITKNAEELVLDVAPFSLPPEQEFRLSTLSVGYIVDFARFGKGTLGFGVLGTINRVPPALEAPYGSRTPLGGTVFLRVRPRFTKPQAMGGMDHMSH